MKPSEIYNLDPIKISYDFDYKIKESLVAIYYENGKRCNWFENLDKQFTREIEQEIESQKKLACKIYMSEGENDYGAMLFSLFYNEKPFMIVKNYGKHMGQYETYLTDLSILVEVKKYMESFSINSQDKFSVYSKNEDIKELKNIDNYDFHHYYDKNLIPKYKENDIVWAFIPLKHSYDKFVDSDYFILTRIKILNINKYNPTYTYDSFSIDIKYDWKKQLFFINHDLINKNYHQSSHGSIAVIAVCDDLILGNIENTIVPDKNISITRLEKYTGLNCFKDDMENIFHYDEILPYQTSFLNYQKLAISLDEKVIGSKLKI